MIHKTLHRILKIIQSNQKLIHKTTGKQNLQNTTQNTNTVIRMIHIDNRETIIYKTLHRILTDNELIHIQRGNNNLQNTTQNTNRLIRSWYTKQRGNNNLQNTTRILTVIRSWYKIDNGETMIYKTLHRILTD